MSEFKEGFNLTQGQLRAYEAIKSGKNVLVLGTSGSGKSTLLDLIRQDFGAGTVFGATTGVANQNLFDGRGGGGTFHSIFSIPASIHNKVHEGKVNPYTQSLFGSTDKVERVCIDEAGMMTPDQFVLMQKRITRFNKKTSRRCKRNIQTILIGDFLQIPPVLFGTELDYTKETYGTTHFFMTELFKSMNFEVVFLDQVMRQKDPEFKAMLDILRYGVKEQYDEVCNYFNKQVKYPLPKDVTMITPYNKMVDKANDEALSRNLNPCGLFEATVTGKYDMKDCPVDTVIKLKVGMPCITVTNHPEGKYQNGSAGIIHSMSEEGAYIKFDNNGEIHLIEPHTFENKEYVVEEVELDDGTKEECLVQKTVGRCNTLPIRLSAGISCHKSQGKTMTGKTIIDLGWGFKESEDNNFGVALTYVSTSRLTDINNMYLTRKMEPKHIRVDYGVINWLKEHNAI